MKKVLLIITLLMSGLFMCGCEQHNFKTQYNMNEEAYIDDIKITLENASYNEENNILEMTFEITNKRDNTTTLVPDQNFVLYDINKVQMYNTYTNTNNIIKKGQTIHYTLQYNVAKKEMYEILFYSGIVENNIKFVLTNIN